MRWDLYCRVVDNFGDAGVCWRLAADLAARGETVRLWIDDATALDWMAPRGAPGVEVGSWHAAAGEAAGEVVIEAFGCDPPAPFIERMAAAPRPPLWINLEYLSAEDYVERSHGLASPQQAGPGRGLTKWFYFPGFTPASGGLLREPGLAAAQASFDRGRWLAEHGIDEAPGRDLASVYCYDGAGLVPPPGLRLLLAPGAAQRQFGGLPGATSLPWLTQPGYDCLLWSCALNIVRGEDSFVRAQWAGVPFVWHIYPQHDGAHHAKLEAFLDHFLAGTDASFARELRLLWRAWNGIAPVAAAAAAVWPAAAPWRAACADWRNRLLAQPDLVSRLQRFVAARS